MHVSQKYFTEKTVQPRIGILVEEEFRVDLEIFPLKLKIILLSTSKAFDTVGGLKFVFLLASVETSILLSELVFYVLLSESLDYRFCFHSNSEADISASSPTPS